MSSITGQHSITVTNVVVVGSEDSTVPVAQFEQSAVSLAETDTAGTQVVVTLDRAHPSGATVVVPFSVDALSTDTAARGVDYELRQGSGLTSTPLQTTTVSIAPGQTSASFWIAPLVQNATQAPEVTLTLTLATSVTENGITSSIQGATIGATSVLTGSLATENALPVVRFTKAESGFDEPGTDTAVAVDVELASAAPGGGSSIAYTLDPTSSALGVWTQTSSSPLTWAGGESGVKQITFTHVADPGVYNGPELLEIELSSPSGCQLGAQADHAIAWREADPDPSLTNPTVGWAQATRTVTEGQNSVQAVVLITNSGVPATPISIPWSVSASSTAQSGVHYTITGTSPLTIPVGSTSASLTVNLPDNVLDEPNTTLVLEIGTATGGGVTDSSRSTHTITIQDDDLTTVGYDPDGVESTGNLDHTGAALAPKRVQIDESDWDIEIHPNGVLERNGTHTQTTDPVGYALALAHTYWAVRNPTLSLATVTKGSENNPVLIRVAGTLLTQLGTETTTIERIQQAQTSSRRIHPFQPVLRSAWTTAQADVGYPVVRDIVFYARSATSLAGMDAWFVQTKGTNATNGSDTTPMLLDNVRFERINFVADNSNGEGIRAFHMPGFTMPGDPNALDGENSHGTIKLYDCRFSSAGTINRAQIFIWCEARANWDIRSKPGLAYNTFGPGSNTEHYHNLYLYSVQPLAGKGNYFIGLTNDAERPPIRTFMQIVNRREAVPGLGTSGEVVMLNITGTGVGGTSPGGSFLSVWGNNGRTYFKNVRHTQESFAGGTGGLFVGHDYGHSPSDHPRGCYPLQLETDRWYTSDEVVVDGYTFDGSSVGDPSSTRYPMQFIGCQTVRLIKFNLSSVSTSATQLSLNDQQNSNSNTAEGFFPGVCFTKELIVSGLLHPTTGAAYGGDLSDYPGWATGVTKGSDGYHQNWWQDLSNRETLDDDGIDAWPDIVDEQYAERLESSGDGLGVISHTDWSKADAPTLPTLTLSDIGVTYLPEPTTADVSYPLVVDWGAESMLDIDTNFEITGDLTEDTHYTTSPVSPGVVQGRDPANSTFAVTEWSDGATPSRNYRFPINFTLLASASAYTTGTKTATLTLSDGGQGPQVEYPLGSGTLVNCPTGSPNSDTIQVIPQVDLPTATFLGAGLATISPDTTAHNVTIWRQAVANGSTSGGNDDGLQLTSTITLVHGPAAGTPSYNISNPVVTFAPGVTSVVVPITNINAVNGDEILLRLFVTGSSVSNLQDVNGNVTNYTLSIEGPGGGGSDNRYQPEAVADYGFEEGSGSTLFDSIAGYNLTATGSFSWGTDEHGGYLDVTGETTAQNGNPFVALNGVAGNGGVFEGNGYTIEAWIAPANDTQGGISRIVGIPDPNNGTGARNVTLGQEGDELRLRARTTGTNTDGTPELVSTGFGTGLRHVVATVTNAGVRTLYDSLEGGTFSGAVATDTQAGAPTGWGSSFPLVLFNELDSPSTFPRHWLGKAYRIIIHKEALNSAQVANNHGAGPTGTGTPAPPTVSWSEGEVSVGEWEGTRTIQVTVPNPTTQSLVVNLSMSLPQASFSSTPGVTTATATIIQGQTTADVVVHLTDNADLGGSTGTISILSGTGYELPSDVTSNWIINSDDAPPTISWDVTEQTIGTAAGLVDVTVTADAYYHTEITVPVDDTGSTASSGSDYTLPSSNITIPAHTLSVTFQVSATGTSGDNGETIVLTMGTPSAGTATSETHTLILSSSIGVKPGPGNTGPNNAVWAALYGPTAATLTPMGGVTINDAWITANGGLLENVELSSITIRDITQDFTLRNFRITGNGFYNLYVRGSMMANIVCEHGEIINSVGAGIYCIPDWDSPVSGTVEFNNDFRATFRHINIHEQGGDATKIESRAILENCWIHHLGKNAGAHGDGVQTQSGNNTQGTLPAGHIVVRNNFFDMPLSDGPNGPGAPYEANSPLILQHLKGLLDIQVTGNWLNGGNTTINWSTNNGVPITDCSMVDNRFGPDYRYTLVDIPSPPLIVNFTRSGNVYDVSASYPTVFAGSGGTQTQHPQSADTPIPGG